jgi:hypothetical protein
MEVIEGKTMNRNPVTMDDDILKKAIRCVESGRLFRIIPKELEFYRKYLILLPVKHPLYRYRDRLKAMPTKQLVMDNNTLTVSL